MRSGDLRCHSDAERITQRGGALPELTACSSAFGRPYEIIAIDDGSTDDTFAQLAALQTADPRLRVIRFRRNFGQTAAFAAGFAYARGRYIVTSDGDLPERSARHSGDDRDARDAVPTSSRAGARIARIHSSTAGCRR